MSESVRKRGKATWEVAVEIGRDPETGRRRRSYRNVKGNKKTAEEVLTEVLHQRDTGIDVAPGRMTVGAYLQQWLATYAKSNVAASTYERYAGIIAKHVTPRIGSLPLAKLRPMHLQGCYTAWQEENGLSAKTVVHHHRLLRIAFQHAVGWQLIAINPATSARPPRPERKDVEHLEPAQVASLLAKAAESPEPLRAIIFFALATGMRQGEILALRWSDVSLEEGRLNVTRTARRFVGKGIVYGQPKTYRSRRPIRLDEDTIAVLRAERQRQDDLRGASHGTWKDNDLVFPSSTGGPMDATNLRVHFQSLTAAAGLGKLKFHALRHTSGTMMAKSGINAKYIADRLGHANATFTINTYVHTTREAEQQAADAVGHAMRAAIGGASDA